MHLLKEMVEMMRNYFKNMISIIFGPQIIHTYMVLQSKIDGVILFFNQIIFFGLMVVPSSTVEEVTKVETVISDFKPITWDEIFLCYINSIKYYVFHPKSPITYFFYSVDCIHWYIVSYWTYIPEVCVLVFLMYVLFLGKARYFRDYLTYFNYLLVTLGIFVWGILFKYDMHVKFFFEEILLADNYSIFFKGLFLIVLPIFFYSVLYKLENTASIKYSINTNIMAYNYYLLALCAFFTFFTLLFIDSFNLFMFYFAMEALNFVIIGYFVINFSYRYYSKAAIRYFCVNAVSSGLFLFSLLIIWGVVGEFGLLDIREFFQTVDIIPYSFELFCVFFFFGSFIKLGIFPFTFWLPSLYEDCSFDIIYLFGVIFKVLFFFVWFRVCTYGFIKFHVHWIGFVFVSGMYSILIGSFGAVKQTDLRRFISFTSTSHFGYLIILMIFLHESAYQSILFYAVNYFICTVILMSLFVITHYRNDFCSKLSGMNEMMFFPMHIKVIITIVFLSLAGFPPTIGFFAKYGVILVGSWHDWHSLCFVLGILSVINFVNYLIIIKHLWLEEHLRVLTYNEVRRTMLTLKSSDPLYWVFTGISMFLIMSCVAANQIFAFFLWLGQNGCQTVLAQMPIINDIDELLLLTYSVDPNLNLQSPYCMVMVGWFFFLFGAMHLIYFFMYQVDIFWKWGESSWADKHAWWKWKGIHEKYIIFNNRSESEALWAVQHKEREKDRHQRQVDILTLKEKQKKEALKLGEEE